MLRYIYIDTNTRDVIFGKMENQNQTDSNEMATTETKCQTDFYSAKRYLPILNQI